MEHLSIMFQLASGPRSLMHLSFKLNSAWFTILQSEYHPICIYSALQFCLDNLSLKKGKKKL